MSQDSGTTSAASITHFQSAGGAQIFQLPLEVFPGFWGYVYLVLAVHAGKAYRVLIDTGSGMGSSNEYLEKGLKTASEIEGQDLSLANLTHVLITHGHIDHFGGLAYVRSRTPAQVGVHELDLRNLTNYEERLLVVSQRLDTFLAEAGVEAERRQGLINMYRMTKSLYSSVQVDFTYEASGMQLGPFQFLHTPGHCAGHVVIRLDDILFSGDHILEGTSPHQSPEHLTLSTGLDHYLKSLDQLQAWAQGISLTLGGHKEPIHDLPARVSAIKALHVARLQETLHILDEPHTIAEVSRTLFGEVHGYNVLLALEEAGAHVEYLYQRGQLEISNLSDLENDSRPQPIYYLRWSA